MDSCKYGYRIVGPTWSRRRLVNATAAFTGYAACEERAEVHREAYLSAFDYDEAFRTHLEATRSTRNYTGPCAARFLWVDIDIPDDLDAARNALVKLHHASSQRYGLEEHEVLAFFSGSKGFHFGVPTAFWTPKASSVFHRVARHFAGRLAEIAGVPIDTGVYDKVRAFRAPNSRHARTKLHKIHLALDEVRRLPIRSIQRLAKDPRPFTLPAPDRQDAKAEQDWQRSVQEVEKALAATAPRPGSGAGASSLNRLTLEMIRDGSSVPVGDRHTRLFSAAANLAEFGCPPALAHALLVEAGLDSGLPPRDVQRQIDCGLSHQGEQHA